MPTSDRPTIVLVHGAWHGPWCWDRLRFALGKNDWETTAPQLPSAAAGKRGRDTAGLHDDFAALWDHVDHLDGPIALVAHSYGGMPVTEVAALRQAKVTNLIYIAAYLPREGDSLFSIHGAPTPEDVNGTIPVPDNPPDMFYADVDPDIAAEAVRRLVPQSIRSWSEHVEHAARRSAPTTYMLCERDQALPKTMQETFAARADAMLHLDSGHSPFLSQPQELMGRLEQVLAPARLKPTA